MPAKFLADVPLGPKDPILGVAEAFRTCTNPSKVNVCVGAYRDETGKPWVLPSVRAAEKRMIELGENKEYSPIEGNMDFVHEALRYSFGLDETLDDRIAGVQALGGTGACRIGGEFFRKFMPEGTRIYIPDITWANHLGIFKDAGLDVHRYSYYCTLNNTFDREGMMHDIQQAPDGSIVLMHACAHNPTGYDPTHEEWEAISSLIQQKKHIVFFDSAYQGFASGDLDKDAFSLRYFVSKGHNIALALSFAKNFGLYGERCGLFAIVCNEPKEKKAVMSQLKLIIRPMYSNPPTHGSNIVRTIMKNDDLRQQYYKDCATMANRIQSMRELLKKKLEEAGSTLDWSHITRQIGMFAFTGMSPEMCQMLTDKYSIFLPKSGRVSLAGLNDQNIDYVAKAIHAVTSGKKITH